MTQTCRDVVDFIGLPFRWGGRGPDEYDCWGWLMELYRRDSVIIPDFKSTSNLVKVAKMMRDNRQQWRTCALRPGAGLLFSIMGYGAHVGYYLDDDRFTHTWEESGGILVERLSDWQHRLLGVYEYVGHHE